MEFAGAVSFAGNQRPRRRSSQPQGNQYTTEKLVRREKIKEMKRDDLSLQSFFAALIYFPRIPA
jgi:hypothetical protein